MVDELPKVEHGNSKSPVISKSNGWVIIPLATIRYDPAWNSYILRLAHPTDGGGVAPIEDWGCSIETDSGISSGSWPYFGNIQRIYEMHITNPDGRITQVKVHITQNASCDSVVLEY